MNTVEIIMQQKKIAADKEKAERKLAYDTIKEWVEKHVDKFAHELLNNIARRFSAGSSMARYRCVSGFCNHYLGEDYPENVGRWWKVEYWNNFKQKEYGFDFVERFFNQAPIEKSEYAENICCAFVSQLVFHTALPELLRSEGFVVKHDGCGCCEMIEVRLPEA